jgi:predicted DNA-binding transcriptional regulator AlpA
MPRELETITTAPSNEAALLVGRIEAARLCGVSPASWDRLTSAGKNPRPFKLGGRVLWQRSILAKWCELGCPSRADFEALTLDER